MAAKFLQHIGRDDGAVMLGYIKKFLLDSFPSLLATIIGAYIVHHYVIPAAAPKNPASAAVSVDAAGAGPASVTSPDKASFEKAVAEKSAIQKAAEKASDKSPESVDTKRRHAAPRVANRGNNAAPDTTGSVETGVTEERRDANDLARAAIERLRNAPAPARTVALAPAHVADEPARVVPPMQPLPPAVAVTKGSDVFSGGAEAAMPSPPLRPNASKLTPPAEIPGPGPIELHAEAQAAAKPSMADDVLSAAKSVFHAVVPR